MAYTELVRRHEPNRKPHRAYDSLGVHMKMKAHNPFTANRQAQVATHMALQHRRIDPNSVIACSVAATRMRRDCRSKFHAAVTGEVTIQLATLSGSGDGPRL
ncbi:hypothetical protein OsI_11707 [Oryza sativa Indica Group]|uniref:Uncharacterized protein n=5 Tax=Oryza TaxID=4527 RepID=A0A0D3H754_9ORYZ|nr:hypothetical protein OsI_11707 [Oryza sativa Indica Group]